MKYHSLNNPSIANAIAIVLLAVVGASPAQAVHGAQNGDRSSSRRRSQGVETTVNKVQSRTARPASRSMNSVRRTDPAPIVSAPIVSAPIVVAKPKSLPQHIGSLLRKIGGPHKSQTSERKNSRSEPTRRGKPAPIIQGDVAHASQRRAEAATLEPEHRPHEQLRELPVPRLAGSPPVAGGGESNLSFRCPGSENSFGGAIEKLMATIGRGACNVQLHVATNAE